MGEPLSPRPRLLIAGAGHIGQALAAQAGLVGFEAALVVLGDQPGITPDVLAALAAAFRSGGRGIVVPTHRGCRGHPLLVAMRYRSEILAAHEGVGLRGLLRAHPEDILEVEVAVPAILEDVDLPADYARASAAASASRGPDGMARTGGAA